MATLNLGRIKPVFQGAYNNSTAYVVDDIVTFGDETFICIQASTGNATSNASYWTKLAAKGTDGTDGTDVGTTLTTQGDILYRDGSGLARLGYGTAGQVLQTGGSGANPSWGTVSSNFVKVANSELSSDASSFTMSNVFTTTYDIYEVYFQFQRDTQSQVQVEFEKSSDGSMQTANYYFASNMATKNASTSSATCQGDWDYSNFRPHENQSNNSSHSAIWHMRIVRPMEALQTRWQHHISQYDGSYARELVGGGWNANNVAMSGIKFSTTSGNMTTGTSCTIYGLKHA